jgi:RNA-directed DNA polymerase
MTPEPKGKLDTMTTRTANAAAAGPAAAGVGVVNGPEDEATDWSSVNWRQVEGNVRRLRQRSFTASQAGEGSSARLRALGACVSRMRLAPHVRF